MLIDQIRNIMDRYGKFMVASVQDRLIRDNTNATGSAVQSVSYELTERGLEILGNKYISAIDTGTSAYNDRPSPIALEQWVKAKGITSDNPKYKPKDIAFAISKKIYERGTIQRFGYTGTGLLQFVIDKNLQPLADDLTEVMEQEISIIAKKVQADVNKN